MDSMTSSKPYILRAFYEWIIDNNMTPYIMVDAFVQDVMVPEGFETEGKITLNLSPSAVRGFEMNNEAVLFSARFNGVPENIYIPVDAVLAIFAKENGEGMMFTAPDNQAGTPSDTKKPAKAKPKKPTLSVVK